MKNLTISIISIIAIIITVGIIASCKKKSDNTTAATTGILYFHLHTDIDTTETDTLQVGVDSAGRHYYFTLAHFYISGITLHGINGTADYNVPNTYLLKNVATEPYLVGNVPTGNYAYVSYSIGIDAAHNHINPSTYIAPNVLSSQTPAMWTGSTTEGYIFMNVKGYADTTAAQNALPSQYAPFNYIIATDSLLKTVTMPSQPFTVAANQTSYVHMIADYSKLLKNVNFKTQNLATPGTNRALDIQIANNIPGMFRYEY